ncbi:unnamed protein product [Psylliodes chrysocephalus]|uniref:Uncharacterized protein n=1 Tax=Psylliodes chrysocephalus TaxID=3402493 RepID=A0A9P0GBR4_9CUCU|nr:unnamed protein product [Psylliodes chrysocephala]
MEDTEELKNISKIQTSEQFKAKTKLQSTFTVSKDTLIGLTTDNTKPGISCTKQREPLSKNSPKRPLNDPQTLLEEVYGDLNDSSSSDESMDTTIKSNEAGPQTDNSTENANSTLENPVPVNTGTKQQASDHGPGKITENTQKSMENAHESMEKVPKSSENTQIPENSDLNTPLLSRSASEDKSDDYVDADDHTSTNQETNTTRSTEGVNHPNPQDLPTQGTFQNI